MVCVTSSIIYDKTMEEPWRDSVGKKQHLMKKKKSRKTPKRTKTKTIQALYDTKNELNKSPNSTAKHNTVM